MIMGKQRIRYYHDELLLELRIHIFEQLPHRFWIGLIKHIANYKCEACGSRNKLEAHHLDRNRDNNCVANGVCLCMECHDYAHNLVRALGCIASLNEISAKDPISVFGASQND